MTRLAVFSDLHGDSHMRMQAAFDCYDYVVFLGDGLTKLRSFIYEYPEKFLYVRGNCDIYENEAPVQLILDFEGVNVLLTHGHVERVKNGLIPLMVEAQVRKVQVVLYGHTHRPEIEEHNGILFVNPGTAASYYGEPGTYAVLTIDKGKYFAEIIKND